MIADAGEIARASERLAAQAPELSALGHERICRAIATAARQLQADDTELGRALRLELRARSGLSAAMIEWCLSTTLGTANEGALLALAARQPVGRKPHTLAAVVLAGNVCTAALRALCLPLIAGVPVLAKASSDDDVLARLLVRALGAADPDVARAIEVVRFGRDDDAARTALLARADVISVYGDDASVAAIARHAPERARLLPHGHGLSALYVAPESLQSLEHARDVAQRAALDTAAYDQRGCLSPHFALVTSGQAVSPRAFAELLEESLAHMQRLLPRGELGAQDKSAALQWRAVAAARGELFTHADHAVSFEHAHALRPSCGARHLGVYEIENAAAVGARLAAFGEHLKCIGVAGSAASRAAISGSFVDRARPPRVTRAGEMQTPPFDADADGLPALEGYFQR